MATLKFKNPKRGFGADQARPLDLGAGTSEIELLVSDINPGAPPDWELKVNAGRLIYGDFDPDSPRQQSVRWEFPRRFEGLASAWIEEPAWVDESGQVMDQGQRGSGMRFGWSRGQTLWVRVDVKPTETQPGERPAGTMGVDFPQDINLVRSNIPDTPDMALWLLIRRGTEAISYQRYAAYMNWAFCGEKPHRDLLDAGDLTGLAGDAIAKVGAAGDQLRAAVRYRIDELSARRALPFPDAEPYRVLKAATELFLMSQCGVYLDANDLEATVRRLAAGQGNADRLHSDGRSDPGGWIDDYLEDLGGDPFSGPESFPYLALIRQKLGDVRLSSMGSEDSLLAEKCYGIITQKLTQPTFLELIWSYWHEEGMLTQSINAVSMRFQNRRLRAGDPLANLEVDPLRPLNNLLWGWVQDEQHRLTVSRRAHEYDHEYGLKLVGRAVPTLETADSRSTFLAAFHTLLQRCAYFFKEYDDKTVVPDAFPVLNALREVHLVLSEGAHNQFGDLPWVARQEMLMTEWILARPEFREFLPTRIMVAYPEPWMDRVDAMKKVQGWTDTSVRHFRDLGVTGEKVLLSIRFGNWSDITNQNQAANWAIFWREEIQWYINSYEAVTGIDLTSQITDSQQLGVAQARFIQPGVHLSRRLAAQKQTRAITRVSAEI